MKILTGAVDLVQWHKRLPCKHSHEFDPRYQNKTKKIYDSYNYIKVKLLHEIFG